jgi:calcineurin-like phosphoesterase family protein
LKTHRKTSHKGEASDEDGEAARARLADRRELIYFTADLHLGHEGIIRLCKRPFQSADEMDGAIIRNWNLAVTMSDEVYILGDFTMKPAHEAHEYLRRLNGRKYLIRGNHDKFLSGFDEWASDFVWVKDYHVLKHGGQKFVLFHYPIAEWDGFYHGSIHLYGHIHNSPESSKRAETDGLAFNVEVDLNGFKPVSMEDVLLMAEIKREGKMSFDAETVAGQT